MKSPEALPRRFGRYLLQQRIGFGGMAEVFRARIDDGAFRKPVCIKRILPHLAGHPGFADMFRDEAALAARCSHANIVQVLDFGEHDGTLFMSLELVDGLPLNVVLKHRMATGAALPVPVALHIAVCMCRALHAAHSAVGDDGSALHIVHRDVSPHNVLLGRDGSVRITDFGIARAVERLTRTNTGVVKGKPSYMAPEQALSEPADHRVDQFATGIVLWEMLAGRPLFRGSSTLAVLDAVVQVRVPPLERTDVDAQLRTTVSRALSRAPHDRFTDMASFEKELEAALVRLRATPADIDVRPMVEAATHGAPRTLVDDAPTDEERIGVDHLEATSSSGVWQAPDGSTESTQPGRPAEARSEEQAAPTAPGPASPAPELPQAGSSESPARERAATTTSATPEVLQPEIRVLGQPRRSFTPIMAPWEPTPQPVAWWRRPVAIGAAAAVVLMVALIVVRGAGRDERTTVEPPARPALCPASAVATDVGGAVDDQAEGRALLARGDREGARLRFEDALRRDPTAARSYLLLAQALPPAARELRLEAILCTCAIGPVTQDCREARALLSPTAPPEPEVLPPTAPPEPEVRPSSIVVADPVIVPTPAPTVGRDEPRAPTLDPRRGASRAEIEAAIKDARVFYLQGKLDRAFDTIRPVTKVDRNNPTAWKLLGMAAQKLNRLQTMCAAYGELLRIQPNGPDAEQARTNRKLANCK